MIDPVNVVAAQRLGLGARPGELEGIGGDPVGWALAQFSAEDPGPPSQSGHDRLEYFYAGKRNADEAKKMGDDQPEKAFNEQLRQAFIGDVSNRALYGATTPRPFRERLVHFWSNHFTVSISRPFTHALAVPFENEAIRPHINGKFHDMLRAVAMHPAMLLYLDNAESIGPDSPAGQKGKRGLNENFAREIMELHTLGVDGGYSQADVTELAKILTGWTVDSPQSEKVAARFGSLSNGQGFMYIDAMHEPGNKLLLGRGYGNGGVREGEEALLVLSTHPATALHIARKLAVHFVGDAPPNAVIDRWARIFAGSGGDLSMLHADIARTPEVWQSAGSKVKTPGDFIISTLRAVGATPDLYQARPEFAKAVFQSYNLLGQPAFGAPSPAGWSDNDRDWVSGSGIKNRIDWSLNLGGKIGRLFNPSDVADQTVGPILSPESKKMIDGAPSKADGLALVLVSPEFMRR